MRHSATPLDFSKAQIANLMTRNTLTQKLLSVTDSISQAHVAIPMRVAGERNREYMLVKNSFEKGGGWVLGTRNVAVANAGTAEQPVRIDTSTDASDTDSSALEFEAVDIPAACVSLNSLRIQLAYPRTEPNPLRPSQPSERSRQPTFFACATAPQHKSPTPIPTSIERLSTRAIARSLIAPI